MKSNCNEFDYALSVRVLFVSPSILDSRFLHSTPPLVNITTSNMSNTINTTERSSEPPRKKVKTDYYSRDVDFDALAKNDADFAAISKSAKQDGWIDFHDPKVVQ